MSKMAASDNPYEGNFIGQAVMTIGAENTNAIVVECQFKTEDGTTLFDKGHIQAHLSDVSTGLGLNAVAPTGGVAAGTHGTVTNIVSGKFFLLETNVQGRVSVSITDSGTPTFYLVLLLPSGRRVVSSAITFH